MDVVARELNEATCYNLFPDEKGTESLGQG